MRSAFTQGIVDYGTTTGQAGGPQNFLVAVQTNSKVDLNVPTSPNQPFQLGFAHRDTNYLLSINTTVSTAWGSDPLANNGPFDASSGSGDSLNEYYLYVDLDLATGLTTYGWSKYRPVSQANEPSSPSTGQHWYDTGAKIMYEYVAAGRFVEKVRCFVAQYTFAVGFTSLSSLSPLYTGTTAGLANGEYSLGSLIFDSQGNVLKRVDTNNKTVFFTTEDVFASGLPTSSLCRIEPFVIQGIAQTGVAAYQPVYYSALNQLLPLTSTVDLSNVIFGLVENAVGTLELGKVTTSGVVNNSAWSWTNVNEQIYADASGNLVSIEADGYAPRAGQLPLAVAINATTILLRTPRLLLATGGLDTFAELLDTPLSYSTEGLSIVRVNTAENGLEFGAELKNLTDVEDALSPSAGHVLYLSGVSSEWASAAPGTTSGVQGWDIHLDQIAALSAATDQFIIGNAASWSAKTPAEIKVILDYSLEEMNNVLGGSPDAVSGDVLRFDGTDWGPYADSNYIQDVFKTVRGDTGSGIAVGITDTIDILGGTGIATTVAGSPDTLVIDWAAALTDLSDVVAPGSPVVADGDVLTRVAGQWQANPIPAQAPSALPRPYDFAAQSFGEVTAGAIMFRYIAPRDFILFDYGHQADSETRPPADMDFSVTLNDAEIGTFRYFAAGTSTVAFNFVNSAGYPSLGGSPDGVIQHAITRGDVLKIVAPAYGSPAGEAIANFDDVSITLRGVVEPVAGTGSLSVAFGTNPSPINADDTTAAVPITVTGTYAYIEYAVIAYSAVGSPTGWYPLDDQNGILPAGEGLDLNLTPGTTRLASESDYAVTTDTALTVNNASSQDDIIFRLQATAFGPAGIATDYIDLEFAFVP